MMCSQACSDAPGATSDKPIWSQPRRWAVWNFCYMCAPSALEMSPLWQDANTTGRNWCAWDQQIPSDACHDPCEMDRRTMPSCFIWKLHLVSNKPWHNLFSQLHSRKHNLVSASVIMEALMSWSQCRTAPRPLQSKTPHPDLPLGLSNVSGHTSSDPNPECYEAMQHMASWWLRCSCSCSCSHTLPSSVLCLARWRGNGMLAEGTPSSTNRLLGTFGSQKKPCFWLIWHNHHI